MANTVSLCMIVKNEAANISLLLDDVLPVVEEAHLVDTGSTDKTLEILKAKQSQYPNLHIHDFKWIEDFSAARNFAFSKATQDWVFWVDGDDRISKDKLRKFKDQFLDDPGVDAWLMDYIYSQFPDGSPQTILGRERFVRRSANPRWIGAIHETVDIAILRQRHYDDLKVVHNRSGKIVDHERNVRILATEYAKRRDPRTVYYYGKELFDRVDDKGVAILEEFLNIPGRYWDDEINARFRLGKAYLARKQHRETVRMAEEIYHLDATRKRAEGYWLYGAVEQDLRNYEIAIDWYKLCLREPPPAPRVLSLEYYTWNPTRRIAECYQALGNNTLMLEYAKKVMNLLPGDADTVRWYQKLTKINLEPKNGLIVLEHGILVAGRPSLRSDSYKLAIDGDVSGTKAKVPLDDKSVDGVVLGDEDSDPEDITRVLKPGGFLWTIYPLKGSQDYESLGAAKFLGIQVYNYIKVDPRKPIIGYCSGDENFGPYRIRIANLIRSARKQGHRTVVGTDCDILITNQLAGNEKAKIKILDLCEWLAPEVYKARGIEYASLVNVCSAELASRVQKEFPHQKIAVVDDHFEMASEDWL